VSSTFFASARFHLRFIPFSPFLFPLACRQCIETPQKNCPSKGRFVFPPPFKVASISPLPFVHFLSKFFCGLVEPAYCRNSADFNQQPFDGCYDDSCCPLIPDSNISLFLSFLVAYFLRGVAVAHRIISPFLIDAAA